MPTRMKRAEEIEINDGCAKAKCFAGCCGGLQIEEVERGLVEEIGRGCGLWVARHTLFEHPGT